MHEDLHVWLPILSNKDALLAILNFLNELVELLIYNILRVDRDVEYSPRCDARFEFLHETKYLYGQITVSVFCLLPVFRHHQTAGQISVKNNVRLHCLCLTCMSCFCSSSLINTLILSSLSYSINDFLQVPSALKHSLPPALHLLHSQHPSLLSLPHFHLLSPILLHVPSPYLHHSSCFIFSPFFTFPYDSTAFPPPPLFSSLHNQNPPSFPSFFAVSSSHFSPFRWSSFSHAAFLKP